MTKEQLAQQLTGCEIGQEVTLGEAESAKVDNLVVVFGASDDLMEFRGAINDEVAAWNGCTAFIDAKGLLPDREQIEDDGELEKYFARKKVRLHTIEALWCKEKGYSWTFKTKIPHATFEIIEGNEKYCRGIVFSLGGL